MKQKGGKAPRLIYKDMDLLARIVRDIFTPEVNKFYVNTSYGYEKVLEQASLISPTLKDRISLYMGQEDIFEYFNIESETERALERKVWLKSGGYIVIDHTEALTLSLIHIFLSCFFLIRNLSHRRQLDTLHTIS